MELLAQRFVHEDDVASALRFAVLNDLDGPFNLSPADQTSSEELVDILGRRRVGLPEPVAFAVAERLWELGLFEAPAGMLHYVMHPWVVSPFKLAAAGYSCAHSSRESFSEGAAVIKQNVRFGKACVKKSNLARGAAGVGLLAAAAGVAAARRSRGRAKV